MKTSINTLSTSNATRGAYVDDAIPVVRRSKVWRVKPTQTVPHGTLGVTTTAQPRLRHDHPPMNPVNRGVRCFTSPVFFNA